MKKTVFVAVADLLHKLLKPLVVQVTAIQGVKGQIATNEVKGSVGSDFNLDP